MKVTYNWLKDFVAIKLPAKALAEKLTMAGLEVTGLEEREGDFVLELEITPNRPDCLSVMGIAREVAAITGAKLKTPAAKLNFKPTRNKYPLKIQIQDHQDCPLYTAKVIRQLNVAPSPVWLKKRLELVGCRTINNVVDVTNYILFTWGEPLHAFDLDKLSGQIVHVRRARPGEKITTIEGSEILLGEEMLVIADQDKPVALAGIIGGKETEVTLETQNILLEAAVFHPLLIRRMRQKLGIQTESSYRFERAVADEIAEAASWQAAQLLQEISQGRLSAALHSRARTKKKKIFIPLDLASVRKILGIEVSPYQAKHILENLGFTLRLKGEHKFLVQVPRHRADVRLEIDLIEEIARIFGYQRLPEILPRVSPRLLDKESTDLVSRIKNILVGLGLNEVITYSLVEKRLLEKAKKNTQEPLEILNPLSLENAVLRTSLVPSLLGSVSFNLRQKQEYVYIFEVAKIFQRGEADLPTEELVLGLALCGTRPCLFKDGLIKDASSLLHLKGILEILFRELGFKDYHFVAANEKQAAIYAAGEKIGSLEETTKELRDELEIKNQRVFVAEVFLERLFAYVDLSRTFSPLPKYPGILRDISLILKENIPLQEVLSSLKDRAGPLLVEVKVLDHYQGKQIPAGFRGLTISCLYRSNERTLREEEINPLQALLLAMLVDKFGVKIR